MGTLKDKAHTYCIDNEIRVSPWPAKRYAYKEKNREYYVAVSLPEDYRKVYKSPEVYNDQEIWDKVAETEIYYYDKHRR